MTHYTPLERATEWRQWDAASLPKAGYWQRRSISVKETMSKDNKELWTTLHPEYMTDHGTAPRESKNVRFGALRDSFRRNHEVINPDPVERWRIMYNKFLSDVKGCPLWKRPCGRSLMKNKLEGWKRKSSGVYIDRSEPAYDVLMPRRPKKDVEEEYRVFHDGYVMSHQSYEAGETVDRKYDWRGEKKLERLNGCKSGQRPDGHLVRTNMKWENEEPANPSNKVVSSRYNRFTDRFKHKLGVTRDPNKDTRAHLHPDHSFGLKVVPQGYGNFEQIYCRKSNDHIFGKEKEQCLVAAVREHAKRANHHNFERLVDAFNNFDRDRKGYLTADDLKKAFWRLNIPLNDELLAEVFKACWVYDNDENEDKFDIETSVLDQGQFFKTLTFWEMYEEALHFETFGATANDYLSRMGDYNNLAKAHRDLARRPNPTRHVTTYSELGCGAEERRKSKEWTRHGVPSIRTDKAQPRFQMLNDFDNYGDNGQIEECVRPSIFTRQGVYRRDMMELRDKEQMRRLMVNSGPQILESTFEKAWKMATECSSLDATDKASVAAFRMVLTKLSRVVPNPRASDLRIMKTYEEARDDLVI